MKPYFEVRLPPALESFVRESPFVAGAVALVAVVFMVAIVAAIVSGLRGRRRRAAIRREPRLYGVVDHRDDDIPAFADSPAAASSSAAAPDRARPTRRGFGLAALTLAFVLGLVTGMAAMLAYRQEIAGGLARLAALAASDSGGAAPMASVAPAVAPAPVASPGQDPDSVPAADVGSRLAAFAKSLEASLPRQAGPDLSLEQVSVNDTTLNLAYSVGRVLPPEEMAPFRAYIDRTVRSLFCAEEAREIRYLSQNGVVFHMTYTDSSGASLSELTVTPAYCG